MTRHHTSGWDRVAPTHSVVMPEGDGLPSTHTPHASQPDRMVTTDVGSSAPLPFTAPSPTGAIPALVAMSTVVLATTVAALLVVLDGDPHRSYVIALVLGVLVAWCALLTTPIAIRKVSGRLHGRAPTSTAPRSRPPDEAPPTRVFSETTAQRSHARTAAEHVPHPTTVQTPMDRTAIESGPGATAQPSPFRTELGDRGRRRERQREPQAGGADGEGRPW
jgi:hypothetical protein